MLKIDEITYEVVYSYYYPNSRTSASPIIFPIMLRKIKD